MTTKKELGVLAMAVNKTPSWVLGVIGSLIMLVLVVTFALNTTGLNGALQKYIEIQVEATGQQVQALRALNAEVKELDMRVTAIEKESVRFRKHLEK
jgi:cell division protein FtsB